MTASSSAPRTFLLTGVTGFLGKVLLEELVRRKGDLGVERIGVVIRPKRGLRAEERFGREVARSECFSRLPAHWTQMVTVLEGNLEQAGLGLAVDHSSLIGRVTHVVHAAASVKFDVPAELAARANVTTSVNLLELARTLPELQRFVYVSTAYVTPDPGDGSTIEEALAPLPVPAAELYEACARGTSSDAELLQRSGHPNTYTLSKSVAEHLLIERGGDVPLTILRPSIMTASREHPFPGWIDSTSGLGAFVVLAGTGHLRALVCDPQAKLDLIPVDEVTSRIVSACTHDTEPRVIRQVVAGAAKAPTVEQCRDVTQRFFRTNRVDDRPDVRYLGPRGPRFAIADFLYHRLPIALSGLRSRAKKRRAEKRGSRLSSLNSEFAYFTTRTFNFRTSLPLDDAYDPVAFVNTVCRGVYRHLLGRDESEWMLAGRASAPREADLRWVVRQPHGNAWIRSASWMTTKVLRRAVEEVTVDVPSFERARAAVPHGATLVLTPSHRSYLDFVLCSYLAFARPDLLPIPHIAATTDFARIPLLGRVLQSMHAFYIRSGLGQRDPELAPRVDALITGGNTFAFFIEGARSRSGEFLAPKRGLLRCLQATGRTCALLPIAISYERVPEHDAFARELAGRPKAKMRLGALVSWTIDVWRGRVDLGRIHIAAGAPVMLDAASDVHAVSHEVIQRLGDAMFGTTVPQPLQSRQRGDTWDPPSTISRRTGVKAAR